MRNLWVIYVLASLMLIIGWFVNIYKLVSIGIKASQWGGMEIARIIGVFVAPLGGFLGWF